jgi:translation initiation factor RLI1
MCPQGAEGALKIVDGKARLVSDVYCDGIGACLGHCPRGAVSIFEHDALEFSEETVHKHLTGGEPLAFGCSSSKTQNIEEVADPVWTSPRLPPCATVPCS